MAYHPLTGGFKTFSFEFCYEKYIKEHDTACQINQTLVYCNKVLIFIIYKLGKHVYTLYFTEKHHYIL